MKLRVGYLLAGAVFAAIVVIVAWAVHNSRRQATERPAEAPAQPTQEAPAETRLEVDDVRISDHDEEGNLRWQVKSAGTLDLNRTTMVVRGTDIHWELIRPGEDVLLLIAPEFVVDYPAGRIALSKGVRAESGAGGMAFTAAQAVYDLDAERLRAEGAVRAQLGDYELEADALGLSRLAREVDLVGGVRLNYQDYLVTADRVVVDTAAEKATLTGNPRVRRQEFTARARTVDVDGRAEQVRLRGAVRLDRGRDLSARAPEAVFDRNAQRARMSGGVTLTADGYTARGRTLMVDGATDTVTLSGGVRVSTRLQW